MPIRPLPPAPSRDDPATFATKADALLGALDDFRDDANALEQSLQLVSTTATSASTLTISSGSKSLVTQPGKAWAVGTWVYLAYAGSVGNLMQGQIDAYNPTTGALSVVVVGTTGGGTYSSWVIGLTAVASSASMVSLIDAAGLFTATNVEAALAEVYNAMRLGTTSTAMAGGTANDLTGAFTPAVAALTEGLTLHVRAAAANSSSSVTFKADGTTIKAVVKGEGQNLVPGDIAAAGHWLVLRYDLTTDKWVLLNPARGLYAFQPGELRAFARTSAPPGTLKANGAAVPVSTYQALTDAIYCGNANNPTASWGYRTNSAISPSGSRSTTGTFIVLPDARGEFIRGWSDGHTTDSGRLLFDMQGSQNASHAHYLYGDNSGSGPSGSPSSFNSGSNPVAAVSRSGAYLSVNAGGTQLISSDGGGEARPRNIAALICIAY